jgi:alkanesulfonate monooxygenase SsuD/methylene tetrahydromethanopterin reductase-like flavin-dependent oxidoreductase (luciferase family)
MLGAVRELWAPHLSGMAADQKQVHVTAMRTHRFGLHLTDFTDQAWSGARLLPRLSAVCQALEDTVVFDTLWINDHLLHLGPDGPSAPRPETMMLLAAAAARTTTLRLGMLVAAATFRHPALLVKMTTTLDVLSGGRAVLGIGAGHPRSEGEHVTYGIPPLGERLDRLEDTLRLTRTMLNGDGPPNSPAPIGPVPVMVGGSGDQRLLRLVARYADMCNFSAPAGDSLELIPHKLEVLKRHCQAVGRDWREIAVTYKGVMVVAASEGLAQEAWRTFCSHRGLPDQMPAFVGTCEQVGYQVGAFLDAGVNEVIVELPEAHDPERLRDASRALEIAAHAQEVRQ